jgi:alkylation response protein AidB-like acyl-CoA dehydrogenase
VRIAPTAEQEALRDELRAYFAALMTPEVEAELSNGEEGGRLYRELALRMGRDGWLGIGWPAEYGGQGRSAVEQFIFFDEAQRAGAPVPFLTINTVGPTLMRYGSDEQRAQFLPPILRGEAHFSIGYSEADAGTDLASLRTSAVFDGDEWAINGSKLWTSLVQHADYVWLAARTNPDVEKHRGISIFIVPTSAPGFHHSPIHTVGDLTTSATFYEDVRVPHSALVGDVDRGWSLITNQLNLERVALCAPGGVQRLFEDVCRWARTTTSADGVRVVDQEWARLHLARVHAGLRFLELANWRSAWDLTQGRIDPAGASTIKVFGSELFCEAYRLLLEVMGPAGTIRQGSPGAILRGRVERAYRATLLLTFGGGTNEVQRDLISAFGLGMKVRR